MKTKAFSLLKLFQLFERLIPYLLLLLGIPLLILLGFGVYAVYLLDYLWYFIGLLLTCTTLGLAPFLWIKYQAKPPIASSSQAQPDSENWVSPSSDWSVFDQTVWHDLNQIIDTRLQEELRWNELYSYALQLIRQAAHHYHPNKRSEWVFTLPEFLKMTEEVSRRYRILVKQHVPLVENINLSTLKLLYEHRDKQEAVKTVWNAYRLVRLITPAGLIAEARSQLLDHVFKDVKEEIQLTMKRAFLQEVASVAIDLYSGRFKIDTAELGASQTWQTDQDKLAPSPEPLRVSLLGQISAGKSAIINALIGQTTSEVSPLPSTDKTNLYAFQQQGNTALNLVDLPGLDGKAATTAYLLNEVTHSDIVLWVLKASQPARALDSHFKQALAAWYEEAPQRSRKQPVIIGILNQVDRLAPQTEWNPPYDLEHDTSAKASSIRDALAYNQDLMQFNTFIPLSVSPDKSPYNLTQLMQLLDANYTQGLQTQLNRRRLEAANYFSLSEQFKRMYRAGQSLFK